MTSTTRFGGSVELDESYVAVQGPPGSGKTYSGSHIIYALIKSGKRVGITAMSHAAIDNLLAATHEVFADKGELRELRALRQGDKPESGPLAGVRYSSSPTKRPRARRTTWSRGRRGCGPVQQLRPFPVDVLVVDEAGQLALADADRRRPTRRRT